MKLLLLPLAHTMEWTTATLDNFLYSFLQVVSALGHPVLYD